MTDAEELEYLQLQKQKAMASSSTAPQDSSYTVPPMFQKVAKGITFLDRTARAAGVAREQMLLHPTDPDAGAAAAYRAFQPGYKPQPGEKLGSFAGGMAGPMNLAANAVLPGGTILKSILGGALSGGGNSILDQASQGKINTGNVGMDAVLGGATGGVTHGMTNLASGFLKRAPAISETTVGIPKAATQLFIDNPGLENELKGSEQFHQENIQSKSKGVQDSLEYMMSRAKAYWENAARDTNIKQSAAERVLAKELTPPQIVRQLEGIDPSSGQKTGPGLKELVPMMAAKLKAKPDEKLSRNLLITLLHIRDSAQHWIKPKPGITPQFSGVQGGLSELYKDTNKLIEQIPGAEILRDADQMKTAAFGIHDRLEGLQKRPGEALEFLKKTFSMEGPNAKDDAISLVALDKMVQEAGGPPVLKPLHDAMTAAYFAPKLAGNKISRAVAGASPFLISAMLRVAGLPFQAAMIGSGLGVSAARSPLLQGKMIRAAQNYGPGLAKAAKPAMVAALNAIRQNRQSGDQ